MRQLVLLVFVIALNLVSATADNFKPTAPDAGPRPIVLAPDSDPQVPSTTHNLTITFDKAAVANTTVSLSSTSSYTTVASSATLPSGQSTLVVQYSISSSAPTHNATFTAATADGSETTLVAISASAIAH